MPETPARCMPCIHFGARPQGIATHVANLHTCRSAAVHHTQSQGTPLTGSRYKEPDAISCSGVRCSRLGRFPCWRTRSWASPSLSPAQSCGATLTDLNLDASVVAANLGNRSLPAHGRAGHDRHLCQLGRRPCPGVLMPTCSRRRQHACQMSGG